MYAVGAAVSGPITAVLMGRIGRKWSIILMAAPLLVGYIMIALPKYVRFEHSERSFYIGRFMTGKP